MNGRVRPTASKVLLFVPNSETFMFFNLISKFPGQDIVAVFKAFLPWCKIEAPPLSFAIILFMLFLLIHSNVTPAASDTIVLGKIGDSFTNPLIGNPCLLSAMHFSQTYRSFLRASGMIFTPSWSWNLSSNWSKLNLKLFMSSIGSAKFASFPCSF
jgi:hypothetical protein